MLNYLKPAGGSVRADTLSGLTVALALVPEAVAFAFLAGISPLIGLYSAFFLCLITAAIGGRPGMISGATGAIAVVIITLVSKHGVEYLFPAVVICGAIQIAVGLGGLGKFIRLVPYPVMLGFLNGLAIVIGLAQLGSFKTVDASGALAFLRGPAMLVMLALVAVTMTIIWQLPKFTRAVPSSLAAIILITLVGLGINRLAPASWRGENQSRVVMTVGDMLQTNAKAQAVAQARARGGAVAAERGVANAEVAAAQTMADVDARPVTLSGGLPRLFWLEHALPPLTWASLMIVLPYALTMAGVGLIESLMTLTLVDEITETRGSGNRECVGQGVANIVCGAFGGMGGCAMIGQSLINVNSGGRGRLSGIVAALCLLAFVLFLAPWIQLMAMPALVGVMFMVVVGTFEWSSLRLVGKVPTSDVVVMVLVAAYTVFMHDLATAVLLGVVVSALVFAWQHATHLIADVKVDGETKIYQLHGPLFFASASSFKELFDVKNDPGDVAIDFYFSRVYDQSGIEAIGAITERYRDAGKRLHLRHLSAECRDLLGRAGDLVEANVAEDPHYHVASDRLG